MLVVVTLLLAPLVALAVHEAGHALAALALGGRGVRVRRIPWGAAVEASFDDELRGPARRVPARGPARERAVRGRARGRGRGGVGAVGAVSVAFGALTLGGHRREQALAAARAVAWSRAKSNDSR